MDANGFSGGAITSEVLGNVQFQGVVIQGAGCLKINFVRFVTADAIRHQISKAWEFLTQGESGSREVLTPDPHTTGRTDP